MNRVYITGIDTSALPKLSVEESNRLLERISKGDIEARELFLNANIRLVLSIVGRFSGVHENADDMFQAGMIGLIKSLNNFDYSYGVCFSITAKPLLSPARISGNTTLPTLSNSDFRSCWKWGTLKGQRGGRLPSEGAQGNLEARPV